MKLTDELLLAYADGLLDDEQAGQVSARLDGDDLARERLRLIRLSGAALDGARAHMATPDGPDELEGFVRGYGEASESGRTGRSAPARSTSWRVAAAAALVAIGFGVGVTVAPNLISLGEHETEVASWIASVVDYHSLYGRATVEPVHTPQSELPALRERIEGAMGLQAAMQIPDLDSMSLGFRRGQVLDYDGWPIVQLVYLPEENGRPIAICFRKRAGEDVAARHYTYHGVGIVQWTHDGLEFLVVGERTEDELLSITAEAAKQLEGVS
jgi:anti-sigma factor RsiW